MGGLFIKRPGDQKRERLEKEDSYTAGLMKGREISQLTAKAIRALKGSQDPPKDSDA